MQVVCVCVCNFMSLTLNFRRLINIRNSEARCTKRPMPFRDHDVFRLSRERSRQEKIVAQFPVKISPFVIRHRSGYHLRSRRSSSIVAISIIVMWSIPRRVTIAVFLVAAVVRQTDPGWLPTVVACASFARSTECDQRRNTDSTFSSKLKGLFPIRSRAAFFLTKN